jgi:hypothetical protein
VLVAAGDVACGPDIEITPAQCQQEATAELVEGLNPDAVLVLGDIAYEQVTPDSLKAYDVVGNHEYFGDGPDAYWDYFGDRAGDHGAGWYSFDVGAWHVVVLNSECTDVDCDPDGDQLQWLADDLAETRASTSSSTGTSTATSGSRRSATRAARRWRRAWPSSSSERGAATFVGSATRSRTARCDGTTRSGCWR